MTFSEVIGQEEVKQRLLQMVDEDRLPHAIMLCGPTGIGKKALAVAFACHLLSLPKEGHAEAALFGAGGEQPEHPMLRKLEHPDLHFTFPTIKLPSMGSDHMPVSDDFAREWHEQLIPTSPWTSG